MARHRLPYVQKRKRRDGTIAFRGWAPGSTPRIWSDTFDTEREAYAAAMRMQAESLNTTRADSLEEACEVLLDELRQKRTKGTVRWYADHLRAVKRLIPGETGLYLITPETIEQFIRDRLAGKRECSPATVNADLRALHRVFQVAIRRGVVHENPIRRVERPRADVPAMDWFRDDELRALIARVEPQSARDMLLLFALTGMRRSEVARLEPSHVRAHLGQIVVAGKTGTRVVPLSAELAEPLQRLLAVAGNMVVKGGTHAIDDVFRAAREQVGDRRMHPHALRHSFGTALIRAAVRPDVVMRLMGHRDLKTTMRYVHECGDEGARAVSLLRLARPDESSPAAQA